MKSMLSEVVEVEGAELMVLCFTLNFLNARSGIIFINFYSGIIYLFIYLFPPQRLPRLNFDSPSQAINGKPRCVRKDATRTFSVQIDLPQKKSAICVRAVKKKERKNVSLS